MPALVTDWMFLLIFPIILAGKSCLLAWEVQETMPISRLRITQQKRYKYNSVALVVSVTFTVLTLKTYGLAASLDALRQWRQDTGGIGWALNVLVFMSTAIPLLSLLNFVHIYRHPAVLGRRYAQFGGYIYHGTWKAKAYYLTTDVRAHRRDAAFKLRPVQPVITHTSKFLTRHYEYIGTVQNGKNSRKTITDTFVVQ